jgi:indoleamine 2,3-dioxygenase
MIPAFTDGFFQTDGEHGFLPMEDPLPKLPAPYEALQRLIDDLPVLVRGDEDTLQKKVLSLEEIVVKPEELSVRVVAALYRAYCFVASAYLLHPSHLFFLETKTYGVARNRLPKNIAQPLLRLADTLDVFPWLEYSFGYSLGNYVRKSKEGNLDYDNLNMACSFTGTDDETGFIMVHVDINQHSPSLIKTCNALLQDFHENKNPVTSLIQIVKVLEAMNASRKKMWEASRWERYNDFRVFIMGSQGNTRIFPHGVVYEPETEPRVYRGQSGSQDTIIPFLDTLFRVSDYYPDNELTGYLMDMRKYRPKPFRDLLDWVDTETRGLVEWLMTWKESTPLLCNVYRQIYEFRNGHWHFVQKYIMANTRYPVATGGTPIVSWLPNQIHATLAAMKRVLDSFSTYSLLQGSREAYDAMVKDLEKQKEAIQARYAKS